MEITFTKHAIEKFKVLAAHGVKLSKSAVVKTVTRPDIIDRDRSPLLIAQSDLDTDHVLRVVYKESKSTKIIITFYPGRKSQYARKK